ncbi:MFS polyamine transporter [Mycena floridula]|nr:MFS polyamine transporter [Mycena floridula]
MSSPKNQTTEKSSTQQDMPIPSTNPTLTEQNSIEQDVLIVDFDGPEDSLNPQNWSNKKKWISTLIVASFTFISPVSSSMVAPASRAVAEQFNIHSSVSSAMTISIFILAYAIGPLFLGPLSEIYGRTKVLQAANLFYLVWNLSCGFAQNKEELIAFRFFAGLGGSAPLAVGAGTLADIWPAEQRGKAIAIYSLPVLLVHLLGPVAGGWIAERTTWRWVFWATSIFTVIVQVAGLFLLKESYAPLLLERKAARIRATMDQEKGDLRPVRTKFEGADRRWQTLFSKAMIRPFALFIQEPIIQIIGIYMALVYGIFYLFLTTLPTIFTDVYHESPGIGGLNYLALGIGLTGFSQVNARYMDKLYVYLKNKNGNVGRPEFRVPAMVPGSILLPVGLLMSGWSAENKVHWIVTDIGIALVGGSIILVFQSMQTYVVDSYTLYAASALAAVSTLRAIAGFGFPLFAPAMYQSLGYGKGNTVLAAAAIILGCPAPFLFWRYGEAARMRSRYKP